LIKLREGNRLCTRRGRGNNFGAINVMWAWIMLVRFWQNRNGPRSNVDVSWAPREHLMRMIDF
jgi:hypothetical protein